MVCAVTATHSSIEKKWCAEQTGIAGVEVYHLLGGISNTFTQLVLISHSVALELMCN